MVNSIKIFDALVTGAPEAPVLSADIIRKEDFPTFTTNLLTSQRFDENIFQCTFAVYTIW